METITINATFVDVDDWSRCRIRTEKGTLLCDTNCHDPEVIKADPSMGHWHTLSGDFEEPCSAIKPEVKFNLVPSPTA